MNGTLDSFMWLLTGLGDSGLAAVLTITSCLFFWISRCRRTAIAVAVSCVAAGFLTASAKLMFFSCARHFLLWDVVSPSGHAAMAFAVYGALFFVAARQTRFPLRLGVRLLGDAVIIGIAASRVILGVHTLGDVIVGGAIGFVVLMVVKLFLLPRYGEGFSFLGLVGVLVATCAVCYGFYLPFEQLLHDWATAWGSYVFVACA